MAAFAESCRNGSCKLSSGEQVDSAKSWPLAKTLPRGDGRGSSAALEPRAGAGTLQSCRVLCRGTVGRAGTQSAGASAGAGVSGTGRAADLDPGWTTKWTRPPLHFSGFVVLGMDFHSFSLHLVFAKSQFLSLPYKCLMIH